MCTGIANFITPEQLKKLQRHISLFTCFIVLSMVCLISEGIIQLEFQRSTALLFSLFLTWGHDQAGLTFARKTPRCKRFFFLRLPLCFLFDKKKTNVFCSLCTGYLYCIQGSFTGFLRRRLPFRRHFSTENTYVYTYSHELFIVTASLPY